MIATFSARRRLLGAGACATLLMLAGCVAYAPPPQPSTFERAYNAMLGAMSDQGVKISDANQSTGTITGTRGNITVIASVAPRPDGSAQVEFKTRGNISEDANLINRITSSYNARMGR
jgi:hypothetical protein